DFVRGMKLLRDPTFQELLVTYPRPPRPGFVRAIEYGDVVSSAWVFRDERGRELKPDDYLSAFTKFVQENADQVDAIRILLDRPQGWSAGALAELRRKLVQTPFRFTPENLEKAYEAQYKKPLVEIISMIKNAVRDEEPLLTASERVERALGRL